MRRLPPNFPPETTDEERKRARESVITNLALFGTLVLVIRVLPLVFTNGDDLDAGLALESAVKPGYC